MNKVIKLVIDSAKDLSPSVHFIFFAAFFSSADADDVRDLFLFLLILFAFAKFMIRVASLPNIEQLSERLETAAIYGSMLVGSIAFIALYIDPSFSDNWLLITAKFGLIVGIVGMVIFFIADIAVSEKAKMDLKAADDREKANGGIVAGQLARLEHLVVQLHNDNCEEEADALIAAMLALYKSAGSPTCPPGARLQIMNAVQESETNL